MTQSRLPCGTETLLNLRLLAHRCPELAFGVVRTVFTKLDSSPWLRNTRRYLHGFAKLTFLKGLLETAKVLLSE